MLKDIILEGGVLFAYSAYFLSDLPVRFQIWRPVDEDNLRFKLVHETRYRARNWDTKVDVSREYLQLTQFSYEKNL